MGQGAGKASASGWPLLAVPGGTDIGGFTVEQFLGAGASGAVYRARRGGALFALKLQPLAGMAGWAEREVSILLRLKHPNVVGFRACGTWPDLAPQGFYLAMELVEGRPLHVWLHEETPDARRVLHLVRGLARGLEVVHAAGVLHRDVKESNIVVRTSDDEPVLVDFGVGDYPGAPRLTQGVLPPGTPLYRSPEALGFRETHWRQPEARYTAAPTDDLFALGVVLYRALTRQYPFPDVDFGGAATMEAPPRPPHEANPRVPRALSTLCLRLLSREPGVRGSALALRKDVEALLAGEAPGWKVPLHAVASCLSMPGRQGAPPAVEAGLPSAWRPPHRRPPGDLLTPVADRAVTPDAERGDWSAETLPPGRPPTPSEDMAARGTEARSGHPPARSRRWWPRVAVLAVLGGCLAVVLGRGPVARREPPATGMTVGGEVARSASGLEPVGAAPPLLAVSTSAVAASAASQQEPDMPVKMTPPTTATPTPSGGWGPMGRALATAAACTGLACSSGPQVRPPPRPEPCPPGAMEAMKELGIKVGWAQHGTATFTLRGGESEVMTVREGPVQIRVGLGLGKLDNGTATGRIFVADRVYGYFDRATTKGGQSFPVCLVLRESGIGHGVPQQPGDTSPDSARIYSEVELEAVEHFK